MPNQIQYKIGQPQSFVAARTFALGKTGVQLPRGADVLYDGHVATFGGSEYSCPELKGAVRAGWLVLQSAYDEEDNSAEIPQAAGMQMRATTGGNPFENRQRQVVGQAEIIVEADEREVGNTRIITANTRERNLNPRGRRTTVVESQDGVPVRTLRTPAGKRSKDTRTEMTPESVGTHLRAAAQVHSDPGRGISEEEYVDRLTPEAREEYLAKKQALRAQYVDTAPAVVSRILPKEAGRKESGSITSTVTTSSGGSTTFDAAGLDPGKATHSTVVIDGITLRNTNGPGLSNKPVVLSRDVPPPAVQVIEASADVRRLVAKQLCKDFPDNYDFNTSGRKKMARLQADYEDRPDVIRAVFAAEGDAFKAQLMAEFPQAFTQ